MEAVEGAGLAMQRIKEEGEEMMGKNEMKVMVALDESGESFYALKWALDNLFGITGAVTPGTSDRGAGTVTLVHVQEPFQHFVFPAGPGGAGDLFTKIFFYFVILWKIFLDVLMVK